MAKSSNKWLERYTDGGLYIPLEGTSYVVRQQISKPRTYGDGGKYLTVNGEYHRIYENAEGDIMVNHPKEDKGKWDTINLTQKAKAKTIAQGIAATKKWHRENPEYANGGLGDGDDPKKPKTVIYNDYNKYLKAKQAYDDSLYVRKKHDQTFSKGTKTRPLTNKEKKEWKDEKTGLAPYLVEIFPSREQGALGFGKRIIPMPRSWYYGHFKKPVVIPKYQKPEEVKSKDESFMFPGVLSYDKKEMTPFAEEDLNFSDYTETINNLKENESEIKKPNTQIKNNNSSSFKNKIKKLKREFFPGYRLPYQYQSAKVPFFENGGLNDQDPPVESLRSVTTYPITPQNFVPIKWDAKTQKENELLQKSINERTKNTPEFKKARKLTKEEQDYSDKVKARIENPSADVGILAANMASALTRLQYLTPDEIKKITNNPKATTELAADILGQGLTNELIGRAVTVAPQAIKSVGKYLTEGPLKNTHKLNPWALTESKIVPEGTVARQIYGDEAFKNFQKYGPTTTPGISEAEQLVQFAKAPTSEIRFRNGEIVNVASTMNKHGFQYPYFSEGKLWFTPEQAKYFGGKERIITTPSSEVFRPAGEASVMMGNPSKEAIEQYARSRRILMPGTEYANPSKYDVYERDWLQGFKKVLKPEQLQENSKIVKAGLPNPLAIADGIIPRLDPLVFTKDGSLMNMSPLNLMSFYGKKLQSKNEQKAYRKFGNTLQDVIERKSLSPKGGSNFRIGKDQTVNEGNWAALDRTWEKYPGTYAAEFDFKAPGSNLGFATFRNRNGVLITDAAGNRLPDIPVSDPGLQFYRRLPFSTRYVPVDKQKLMNNKFQLATQGSHLQSLAEKYGYGLGAAASIGLLTGNIKEAIDKYNKYTIDPIINWSKKQHSDFKKETGIDLINILKTKSFKQQKENGGWLNKYEQGGYADDSAVLNSEGQEVNTMQFALPTVPTFNFGNGNGNGNGDGEDPKDKKKSKDKKTDTRTIGQKRHDALEAAKTKILKTESPENKKKMDMLYSTTMAAENTYGYDSKAYGRKKQTRSPMSIDNIALDELFNPKGEKNRYTLQQKSNFDLLRSLGLPTDKAKLKELLETDDAYAGLGVAKTLYYNEGALKNLPNPTDTAAYINLYLDEYNKKGALKYQKRNELIDNITNKMRAQGKRETKTIKPVVKNKTTK